jgi:hypothetical protein
MRLTRCGRETFGDAHIALLYRNLNKKERRLQRGQFRVGDCGANAHSRTTALAFLSSQADELRVAQVVVGDPLKELDSTDDRRAREFGGTEAGGQAAEDSKVIDAAPSTRCLVFVGVCARK